MVKKFEQYIKESLELNDFKFEDNFQALFDMFEKDGNITIVAHKGDILFKLILPTHSIEAMQIFNNQITEFTNELKYVLESLDAENIKHSVKIKGETNYINIKVIISKDSMTLNHEFIENELDKLNYYIEYFSGKSKLANGERIMRWKLVDNEFFDEPEDNDDENIKLNINSNEEYEVNTDKINSIIKSAIGDVYEVVKSELNDAVGLDDDELDYQIYSVYLKKI